MKKNYKQQIILTLLMCCISIFTGNAQSIQQLGTTFYGTNQNDNAGTASAISDDGTRVAVGYPGSDEGNNDSGQVRVFDFVGGAWTQVGGNINGVAAGEHMGGNVAINKAGNILAISGGGQTNTRGIIRVYELIAGTWTQLGADINGVDLSDHLGVVMDLDASGTVLALGAPNSSVGNSGFLKGYVKVFKYSGGIWTQIGAQLNGAHSYETFGAGIALDDSGNRLAVGDSGANSSVANFTGKVNIYDKDGSNNWVLKAEIYGLKQFDYSGASVDLSANGNILISGSSEHTDTRGAQARVYDISNITSPTQIGADITVESFEDLAAPVSISNNGNRVLVAGPHRNVNGHYTGYVRIFDNIGGTWTQIGGNINGEASEDQFGASAAINGDGSTLIVGADHYDVNGTVSNAGQAKVFFIDEAPTAVCQNITVQLDASGNASITGAAIDNGSSDQEGPVSLSVTPNTFTCASIGTPVDVTLTVTDGVGQTDTCTATVIVEDNIAPIAICQNITVALDDTGQVTITPNQIDNGSNDACSVNLSIDVDTFDCSNIGANTVTLTVTDNSGNSSSCPATVTVEDTMNPTVTCAANATRNTDSGTCEYTVQGTEFDPIAIGDNCGVAKVRNSINGAATLNGVKLPIGNNTVGWFIDDVNGNSVNCSMAITVEDNQDPTITCAANATRVADSGVCGYTVQGTEFDATSNDNCNVSIVNNFNLTSTLAGEVIPPGVNNILWRVTDPGGNSDTCTMSITVEDNEDPTPVCQNITVALDNMGQATIQASQIDNGSTDNCGIANLSLDKTSFDCSNIGANTVTLTVTDTSGNTATCTATVTVEDTIKPVVSCLNSQIKDRDSGVCYYTVQGTEFDPTSSDNCTVSTVTNNINNMATLDGAQLPVGTTAITWTVTDSSGNQSSCSFSAIIINLDPPVIDCVPNGTREIDSGVCTYTVQGTEFDATVSNACNNTTLINDFNGAATLNGAVLPLGNTTVTWTAKEDGFSDVTCTTVITVEDNVAPVAMCKDVELALDANGTATLTANDMDNGSSDNCGGPLTFSFSKTDFDCNDFNSAFFITMTVTDASGNSSTCQADVLVVDKMAPVVTCPGDMSFATTTGLCDYLVEDSSLDATYVENCPDRDVVFTNDYTGSSSLNGASFPVGVTTVTWTATDNYGHTNSNSGSCSMTVTVADNEPPVVYCDVATVYLDANGNASIDEFDIGGNTGFDNCSGTNLIFDVMPNTFDCFDSTGDQSVTMTVTDESGNSTSCTTKVTVLDKIPPTFTCPANATRSTDASFCNYQVQGTEFDPTNIDDNCSNLGWTISNNINFSSTLDGALFNLGDNDVIWSVTDFHGNNTTCTMTITIEDNESPTAICKDATVHLDSNGTVTISKDDIDNGSSDNCSSTLTYAFSPSTFDSSDLGPNTVTMFVADAYGNSKACTATVTVEETLSTTDVNSKLQGVSIYPNPASDKVIIRNARQESLKTAKIYDIRGSLVKKVNLNGMGETLDLDISALEGALYLLKVEGENGSKEFKLMVK
ncbi:HYR domain-containing protein [Tamlana sp. I1]|uniref:HYR domain-containing protein n=1 Tax=Tamlana sp. I1 TaxID=2762061 RepID=UPI00188F1D73|nr:HYR domain-containing protein [Tamlana sp. I1]